MASHMWTVRVIFVLIAVIMRMSHSTNCSGAFSDPEPIITPFQFLCTGLPPGGDRGGGNEKGKTLPAPLRLEFNMKIVILGKY